jgi:hypothetical protein
MTEPCAVEGISDSTIHGRAAKVCKHASAAKHLIAPRNPSFSAFTYTNLAVFRSCTAKNLAVRAFATPWTH